MSTQAKPLVLVEALVKEFKRVRRKPGRFSAIRTLVAGEQETIRAVDNISLTIDEGEFVGYLGPNGAGKSTSIKMLTGIMVPTSGRILVAGADPSRSRRTNALNVGVVFGQRTQLWWDLPLDESFRAIKSLYGVKDDARQNTLVELLGLTDVLSTPVRQLSLGQRMRGDLVAAMLHNPPLLFLDEPTVGLDVLARNSMREFLAESNQKFGTTIILTTHDLEDVERLCNRIVLIDHGRVLYDGDLGVLVRQYAPFRDLVVTVAKPNTEVHVSGTTVVSTDGSTVTLRFDPTIFSAPDLISTLSSQYDLLDLAFVDPGLESVIAEIYSQRNREDTEC